MRMLFQLQTATNGVSQPYGVFIIIRHILEILFIIYAIIIGEMEKVNLIQRRTG
jgi:hypothetical protein